MRDKVLDWLDSPEFARALKRARAAATAADRTLAKTMTQLGRDRGRLTELGDLLADSTIDPPEYRRLAAELTQRIGEAERTIERVEDVGPILALEGQSETLPRCLGGDDDRRTARGGRRDRGEDRRAPGVEARERLEPRPDRSRLAVLGN